MPVKYRFDANITVIEMTGEYSMDELRTAFLDSLADNDRPADSFLLINLTESLSFKNRPSNDIKAMASFVASLGKRFNNRIALVAPDDLRYGLIRMGSSAVDQGGIDSRVFRDFTKARNWLLS
ncbi:MAG TPA: hypothetical protein VLX91_08170 [Candidatus Acidoferrales bacterium]|nr:hypothetical protein [Candidatus Acidoferrales bacterium]